MILNIVFFIALIAAISVLCYCFYMLIRDPFDMGFGDGSNGGISDDDLKQMRDNLIALDKFCNKSKES
jgi:hypothetical protein